jgi:hypothetical protein
MYKGGVAFSGHSKFNENVFMLSTGIKGLENTVACLLDGN